MIYKVLTVIRSVYDMTFNFVFKNIILVIKNAIYNFTSSTTETKLSIISALIALVSAYFSYNQAQMAKKTYKMQIETGKSNLIIKEIKNCFVHNERRSDNVFYFFQIQLSNLSDKATSVNKIQLKLINSKYPVIINKCDDIAIRPMLNRILMPANISPNNSITGWAAFEVQKELYKEIDIDSHYILVHDIHGNVIEKEEIYVREEFIDYDI